MLSLSQKLLNYLRRANIRLAAFVGIVTAKLDDEQNTQGDWEAGEIEGAAGADYPSAALSAQLLTAGTTATVTSASGFTIGSSVTPGYLEITDGTDREIVYYTGSTGTAFTGLIRAQYGTTARQWEIGATVNQLTWSHGASLLDPYLQLQPKNWTQITQTGTGGTNNRMGAGMVYSPATGLFYVFGGLDNTGAYKNDLYTFNPTTNVWAALSPSGTAPAARAYFAMVYHPSTGEIWIAGGRDGSTVYGDVFKYNVAGNSWSTNAAWNMLVPLHSMMACNADTYALMVVAGGATVVNPTLQAHYSRETYIFYGNVWNQKARMSNGAAFFYGAFGAACWMSNENLMMVIGKTYADTQFAAAYDPWTDVWKAVAFPPVPRYYASLVYDDANHYALMFGGHTAKIGGSPGTGTLYRYSYMFNTWVELAGYSREGVTSHCAAWDSDGKQMVVWGGATNAIPNWRAYKEPMRFNYYWAVSKWVSHYLDVGAAPADEGMWILEDSKDSVNQLTNVAYTGDYSDVPTPELSIDSCDATTGWTADSAGIAPTLDTTTFKEGAASLNLGKSGTTVSHVAYSKTVSTFDGTNNYAYAWIYITDKTILNSPTAMQILIYATGGFYYKSYSRAALNNGWNLLGGALSGWTVSGSPDIAACISLRLNFFTNNVTDLIPLGDLKMDYWHRITPDPYTSIGEIKDGDEITDLHRYWKIHAVMTNSGLNDTPKVQRLDALFDKITYYSLASMPVGDYPPIIENISSLTSQADPVKCTAKIGGVSFGILNTSRQAVALITDSCLRGKTVKIKLGALEDDFAVSDFQQVLKGRIEDWEFDGNALTFDVADYLGDLKRDIPQEADDGTIAALVYNDAGIASNPIDIMLDILQNQTDVPDRDIDFNSFAAVKSDSTLSGWKFNRTLSSPEDAYDLMVDICRHIGAILIPRENGKIALKILKATDTVVDAWNEKDHGFKGARFKGQADSIRNFISTWWHWDGAADKWSNFEGAQCYTDATSITNWGRKTLRTMSKWLGDNGAPYYGDTRALAISQRILEMSKNGIPIVSLETNMSAFPVQIGDLIRVQSGVLRSMEEYREWQRVCDPTRILTFHKGAGRYSIPYLVYGCSECIDKKWWVTKKQVDFVKGTIKWELARAKEVPLSQTFTSQAEFYKGCGAQIDLDTSAGSVQLAADPEAVPPAVYFASGTFDLIIDLGQQPDQPGTWTFTTTAPYGTTITCEAWASEMGLFQGEEVPLGTIVTAQAVSILTRFYKVRATLNANGTKNATPKLDSITLNFANG